MRRCSHPKREVHLQLPSSIAWNGRRGCLARDSASKMQGTFHQWGHGREDEHSHRTSSNNYNRAQPLTFPEKLCRRHPVAQGQIFVKIRGAIVHGPLLTRRYKKQRWSVNAKGVFHEVFTGTASRRAVVQDCCSLEDKNET